MDRRFLLRFFDRVGVRDRDVDLLVEEEEAEDDVLRLLLELNDPDDKEEVSFSMSAAVLLTALPPMDSPWNETEATTSSIVPNFLSGPALATAGWPPTVFSA